MRIEVIFGVIYVIAVLILLIGLRQLTAFYDSTKMITDILCLERYKSMVRVQMYLALLMIWVLGAGMIVGLMLAVKHGTLGVVAIIVSNGVVFGLAKYTKGVELKIRDLDVSSEVLKSQFQAISSTWVRKALPDF